MNYTSLTDDEIRLEIARRKGWAENALYEYHDPLHRWIGPPPLYKRDDPPNWPGSIADAWGLVEEINHINNVTIDPGVQVTVVQIYTEKVIVESAHTAPRAICLAWLMWDDGRE
jgi:hypothetical protein